ncbi:C-terminal domain phosphatase-like 4 [Actinidia rufa]|uniref:RNA polymerase II C-terminal domain phosphatase-like n=1 Tax=Actinidia rufa TaxID=165716 RepID=A0A7J0FXK0_9ERIC|nr:C-terminal domain phosphatase-like 4 [Actinidia rufa]
MGVSCTYPKVGVYLSLLLCNEFLPFVSLEKHLLRGIYAHILVFIRGLCMICGQKVDDTAVLKYDTAVALKYIHKFFSCIWVGVGFRIEVFEPPEVGVGQRRKKLQYKIPYFFRGICGDLRLGNDEMVRLRNRDLKNLLRHKKLYLVLDLDHTLLNSTRLLDITPDEEYLKSQTDSLQDISRGSLFRLDSMHMLTKLRPFVRTFLKEASNLFEMYIYTMGERAYALEMANLLDPGKVYFNSRVIAQDDCTQRHQKGLDVVLGQESAVLILDDTEPVWAMHKENLILMERYNFFGSSCRQFGFRCKSLSELKSDESETDGALAYILKVLKQIHSIFFDSEPGANLADKDVRQVIKTVRKEVLKGCTIRLQPQVDQSVTHVVSIDTGTKKSRWAVKGKKFVIHPRWIEAANYFWQKQPEEYFPINQTEKIENQ